MHWGKGSFNLTKSISQKMIYCKPYFKVRVGNNRLFLLYQCVSEADVWFASVGQVSGCD